VQICYMFPQNLCKAYTNKRVLFVRLSVHVLYLRPCRIFLVAALCCLITNPNHYSLHNNTEALSSLPLRGQSLKFLIFGCNSLVGVQDEGYQTSALLCRVDKL